MHGPRYGLSLGDGLALAKLSLTPEASLEGQLIRDVFSPKFFETEFWLLWSTLMGSLPQHSVIEFRRYLNRFVYLFPDLSTMAHVFRSQFNQHEAFIKPLVAWLEGKQVNFVKGALVKDVGFAESSGRLTANRLDIRVVQCARPSVDRRSRRYRARDYRLPGGGYVAGNDGRAPGSAAASRTVVGVVEDIGREAQRLRQSGRVLRRSPHHRLALGDIHGHHDRPEFLDEITNLTHSGTGSGGLLTLQDFELGDLAVDLRAAGSPRASRQAHRSGGAMGSVRSAWATGMNKPMVQCTGEEILRELLQHLGLRKGEPTTEAIVSNSICIPCDMPYVNNIWLPRKSGDRPQVVPEGVTNLGLLGQYIELEQGHRLHVRIFHAHGLGSGSSADETRSAAAARLSGPVRSEGRVGGS